MRANFRRKHYPIEEYPAPVKPGSGGYLVYTTFGKTPIPDEILVTTKKDKEQDFYVHKRVCDLERGDELLIYNDRQDRSLPLKDDSAYFIGYAIAYNALRKEKFIIPEAIRISAEKSNFDLAIMKFNSDNMKNKIIDYAIEKKRIHPSFWFCGRLTCLYFLTGLFEAGNDLGQRLSFKNEYISLAEDIIKFSFINNWFITYEALGRYDVLRFRQPVYWFMKYKTKLFKYYFEQKPLSLYTVNLSKVVVYKKEKIEYNNVIPDNNKMFSWDGLRVRIWDGI